jgi:hypothetical protein
MIRTPFRPARFLVPGMLVIATLVQACSSDPTAARGTPPDPRFILSLGAATIALAPGGAATTSIKALRSGGLTSVITYAVSSAPSGLAVSVAGTSVPDSSTLNVTASPTLAVGTYQVIVSATTPDAPAEQATVVVIVSAPAGGDLLINSVAAGAHTCALTTTGAAYCWGYNADGQLGNNDTSLVNPTPVAVAGGLEFASISVSKVEGVSCGLTPAGAAYC